MVSKSFLEKLLLKLKTGNSRSIHLNALPGRFARLDLHELINIDHGLHLKFLRYLLTRKKFTLPVSVDFKTLREKSDEETQSTNLIIKKLDSLFYQHQDEFLEHGTKTFAFGYPLLIKRDASRPERILKAPLIIWHLDLSKDIHKGNTWHISRSEDHPVIFNEVLRSHLETHDRIAIDDMLPLFEDEVIGESAVADICRIMLEKLGTTSTELDTELKVLPGTNRESIEKLTQKDPWIRWSGILGLYKTQKQSIIRDIESLIKDESIIALETSPSEENDSSNFSAVSVDPSQEAILNRVKEHGKIIIQGPPGTGKSQSLTALISDSLYRGETCLVVCEKKTALDVIHQNLNDEGLADLCITIDDIFRDRRKVVDQVRHYMETREDPPLEFRQHEHDELVSKHQELKDGVVRNISQMNIKCFGDDNLTELMARMIRKRSSMDWTPLDFGMDKPYPDLDYAEYRRMTEEILEGAALYKDLPGSMSFDKIEDSHFSNLNLPGILFPDILRMLENIDRIEAAFEDERLDNGSLNKVFNDLTSLNRIRIGLGRLVLPKFRRIRAGRDLILTEFNILQEHFEGRAYYHQHFPDTKLISAMQALLPALKMLRKDLEAFYSERHHFEAYQAWRNFLIGLPKASRHILENIAKQIPLDQWPVSFEIWYTDSFIEYYAAEKGIHGEVAEKLTSLGNTDDELQASVSGKIMATWSEKQKLLFRNRTISGVKQLYNYRRNKKYGKRNSLRKIIHQDPELFATAFPVIMVNPVVCSSILPLKADIFDCVIFDESSQIRIEDTFAALLRGRKKIISGDKHQMPPTSYFMSNVVLMDDRADLSDEIDDQAVSDEFLADSTSLLEYGMDTNFQPEYLDFHYRSRHPDLIAFSNAAFYGNRLVPMPPRDISKPMEFHQVNGSYTKQRTNIEEANAIVEYVYNSIPSTEKKCPSVGIATFNINQRNLIWDMLMEATYAEDDPGKAYAQKLDRLIRNGLFVKNLENIQGDERDIILISTTFGPDKEGKFRQLFGPITQAKGYQLLNVIISRAKEHVAVFTSIPEVIQSGFQAAIESKGNTGKGIFYSYLAYTDAVASQRKDKQKHILDLLSFHCNEKPFLHEARNMPLFLQLVYTGLLERYNKEHVTHNYRYGGFILEIVILKEGLPVIAISTSCVSNPLPTAYRMYLFKDKMLKERGMDTYMIDAFAWYNEWQTESEELFRYVDDRLTLI